MELGQWKSARLVDYKTLLTENEKLKQDIDQYKLECDELSKKLDNECNMSLNIEGQLYDAIKQRDELIKNADAYKLEINNLKQSVSDYKDYAESFVASYLEYRALEHENDTLKSENKALRLQANEYFDLWQEAIKK